MKYIKTNKGIWEVSGETDVKYEISIPDANDDDMAYVIYKDQVVDFAKTIYALCDEFRYDYECLKPRRCYYYGNGIWHDFDSDKVMSRYEIRTIKGCIWTPKGLIYAAELVDDKDKFRPIYNI